MEEDYDEEILDRESNRIAILNQMRLAFEAVEESENISPDYIGGAVFAFIDLSIQLLSLHEYEREAIIAEIIERLKCL